ncbi:MAG: UDP-N-acetylglucosamine 1-carboxyvinyltransferase [Bacilli bacterium]|nr:UDP-N-acetylglucosamine 1-carboxyvinyltransferase [Bacilli bacterium]
MHIVKIKGGKTLSGEIVVSGAKNSIVGLMPAAVLCDEDVNIYNVPHLSDVDNLIDILEYLNVGVESKEDYMKIIPTNLCNKPIHSEFSKKLRASYYFMGALLGKYGHVEISFPGGCVIGARPIDLHLKGFKALGATITENGDTMIIDADELIGTNIYLDFASVGATINLMLAAVKAKGKTVIENAAKEPEIVNIATFLNSMGANISGAGTNKIKIEGVEYLSSCFHEVIPDRIEAGTFIIMGAALGDHLKVSNLIPEHVYSLTEKLREMGVPLEIGPDYVIVSKPEKYNPVDVQTLVYPGFVTDHQQLIASLMVLANGTSSIEETIYENRFQNLYELSKMGARIKVEGKKAYIYGPTKLTGTTVMATDLRAGAGLVIAGLMATGETEIQNADYILRGYENIVEKLSNIGAELELI